MNEYVEDFYSAFELMDEDLELLAQACILVKQKGDTTRPNIINSSVDECKFKKVHRYTVILCDMPYKQLTELRALARRKLAKKKETISLFD